MERRKCHPTLFHNYALEAKRAEMEKLLMEQYRDKLAHAGPKERKRIMKDIQEALESYMSEESNKIIRRRSLDSLKAHVRRNDTDVGCNRAANCTARTLKNSA